nr:T9SS type A sorting domain-containing protein [Saprospiraceae bacterium]
ESPIAPEAPAPLTVQCADDVPAADSLTATDNCDGEITGIPTDVETPGDCPNSFTVTRTWTFTDECGNESTISQVITVEDTEAPIAPEAPAPLTVQCADDVPAVATLTATDNCDGEITGVPTDVVTPGDCPNSFTVVRTWTFTDECGNASTVSQTITVDDTEAPVPPETPESLAFQCADDVPAGDTLTAVDNCDGEIIGIPVDESTGGDCPNSFVVTRTWTFTDACGNSSTVTQMITVEDTEAPVPPDAPAPLTVQCADDVPAAEELTAMDNCSGEIVGVPSDEVTPGDCPNNFTVVRTWTFTDECGINSSTVTQIITVNDTEAPVAPTAPSDTLVECAEDVPMAVDLTAMDNCDGEVPGELSEMVDTNDCGQTITRMWTFTDACGNASNVSQVITVLDTVAPNGNPAPEPISIECTDAVPDFDPQWTDNCDGELTTSVTDSRMADPDNCGYTLIRTFTATDDCGNSTAISQVVFVTDTQAPTFTSVPEDQTFECLADIAELPDPVAVDNCGEPTVTCTFTEDLDEECLNGTIVFTCTAVDSCGNSVDTSFTITILDTSAPELVGAPDDLVLACEDEVPDAPEVTAIDNCTDSVTVSFTEEIIEVPVVCKLSQPDSSTLCHDTENWSVVMFDLPYGEFFSNVEATLTEFPNGTAHLTGTVSDNLNPAGGLTIDVWLKDGMNWQDWSTQSFPTSFKDECGTGNHEDWTYYLINADSATLTGYGNLAGSEFTLTHAPINNFLGYQVGLGANNVNESFGHGGWFVARGTLVVNGETFTDIEVGGDFAFDSECCPGIEVRRTWTATDCVGNTTEVTQTITYDPSLGGDDGGRTLADVASNTGNSVQQADFKLRTTLAPNPTSDGAMLTYELNEDSDVSIEVYNVNGQLIQKVFDGAADADFEYTQQIKTDQFAGGIYLIRISTDKQMSLSRLVVVK